MENFSSSGLEQRQHVVDVDRTFVFGAFVSRERAFVTLVSEFLYPRYDFRASLQVRQFSCDLGS